ncbi:amidase [Nocardioides sp. TRM66260-LWL]|uniref:amidase n=1 Tax=Nocardioides sp. TRM66260-LWL TaxID=2874478 RepID=UPI001CC42CD2|nr:amidase [Nocardioides sp. TRM66260-LWL]MBZ5735251.1 amidase [Nocardioides sp. TRM66260-LWL]
MRLHAFRDDALGTLDAVGLVAALHAGEVSVPEVVEAAIARTEAVAERLGALALRTYGAARAEAAAPRPGWFAGVPTVVKDNVEVAGLPAQHGSDAFRARPARADGDLARMLLATGVVPIGTSQLSEFGFSASAEHPRLGPVRSPWDLERTAGASSAGSGALVAAGAVPIAHGNDGGGSIRIPAAVNGLVGLKPSRGRLAGDRLTRRLPVRIVSDGVLTRTVRDTAAFLREAEKVYRPLDLRPVDDITRPGRARLRIAVATAGPEGEASAEAADAVLAVASRLEELGHSVERLDDVAALVPAGFADDFLLHWGLLALGIVRGGRLTFGPTWRPERTDELTRGLAAHAQRHLHRLPGAIRRLRSAERVSAAFFERFDVLLTPTLGHRTPAIGHLDGGLPADVQLERLRAWVAFTPLANVTGDPSLSMPLGRDADSAPLGVLLGAGRGREARLLELAYELEEALPPAAIWA